MIELRDVTIRLGVFLLDRISFHIDTGRYAVLMGRTGRGKTTILEAICGLRPVLSGCILLHGIDLTAKSPAERDVSYVPQDLALFPTLTVREHLEFALRIRRRSPSEIAARTAELSRVLDIGHLLDRGVKGLSGGESQRVALGRALAARPGVLLLDEPLSALDESTRLEMQSLLKTVQRTTGVTILHVTHSAAEAEALADVRLTLDEGRIVNVAG